jgi:hypothetical protein
VRLEHLGRVRGQVRDSIILRDSVLLERDGEAPDPIPEAGPGQSAVAVDDSDPIGKHGGRALEEGERCKPREVDGLRHLALAYA